jgi:PBP1b-binding outer membrane lipoprotein LpoB
MLKQNLTKVIAVATIAAGAIFITGCTAEEEAGAPVTENDPLMDKEGKIDENNPPAKKDTPDADGAKE